jgi:DNA-binding GntR family transcriptional regulator
MSRLTSQATDGSSPVWYRTTQEAVAGYLRGQILHGEIGPGTRLLQAELASDLEVSTTPVREALRRLVAEGLLDGDPNRGVVVHGISREELEDIYEIRMALEPLAIEATVERITPEELADAAGLVDEMDRVEHARYIELNARFHELLADAGRRHRLGSILGNLRELSTFYVAQSVRNDRDRELMTTHNEDHRRLVAACKSGDVSAAQQAQRDHLALTLAAALAHLAAEGL